MTFQAEYAAMIPAVRLAAALIRRVQQTMIIAAEKAGREPVTIADYGSQAVLCRMIQAAFPADAVIAEERAADFQRAVPPEGRARTQAVLSETLGQPVDETQLLGWLDFGRDTTADHSLAPRTWVIDPIDGTTGFLAGRRYTIALALLVDGAPAFSLMGCPKYVYAGGRGLIFGAGGADGPRAWPLAGGDPLAVGVSQVDDPAEARGVESVEIGHTDHRTLDAIRESLGAPAARVVHMDGQDKYAAVAHGDADYYLRLSPTADRKEKTWDHAAGAALVAAAGGAVTDLDGRPLDFSLGARLEGNRGIIASNGVIHAALLAAVRAAGV